MTTLPAAHDHVVIYHGDGCFDGFGAAFVAWQELGDRAIYHPVFYGAHPGDGSWPDIRGKHVLVVDYALPVSMVEEVRAQAASFTQLDHHDTAYQIYKAHDCCGNGCLFDLDHSGVMLAWQHFHGHAPAPNFVRNLEDQDLWRFRHETTIPFSRGARTRPMTFESWSTFSDPEVYAQVVRDGRVLEAQWCHWMHEVAAEAVPVDLLGEKGLMVGANGAYRSELGNLLASRSGTYGMMWHGRATGEVACSLRSIDVPCKPLGQRLGGGGHDHASGFRRPSVDNLKELVGADWDLNAAPVWAGEPSPVRLSEDERADAAWERVDRWQRAPDALQITRVDGRPVGEWPTLTTAQERRAAGRLLEAHRQQIIGSVITDAVIEPIPGDTGQPDVGTRATVFTDSTLLTEVAERLLDQGHLAVQTVRITRDGVERRAHGAAENVLAAWPDVRGIDAVRRHALDEAQQLRTTIQKQPVEKHPLGWCS